MDVRISPDKLLPHGVVLTVDGAVQSTIDMSDPTHLVDEYCRHLGFLVDEMAPPRQPLRVLHLGAGALAMARYVAATRPRSYQQAVELDPDLVALVRREAPLARGVKVKIRVGDARAVLADAPDACYDLIIADLFSGTRTPAHVTTLEFLTDVSRVLRPDGCYAANVCDGGALRFSRGVAAAAHEVFADNCVFADAGVLRGRRFGNLLLFGAKRALPIDRLQRRAAGTHFPVRICHAREFVRFVRGTPPTTDADATDSPRPPTMTFG